MRKINKIIILILILALFCNVFVPKHGFFSICFDGVITELKNQQILQCYYVFSSIPINIVNQLFVRSNNAGSLAGKKSSNGKEEDKTNTSSDFFITNNTRNININRSCGKELNLQNIEIKKLIDFNLFQFCKNMQKLKCRAFCINIILSYILMIAALLPRGKIEDFINIILISKTQSIYNWIGFLFMGRKIC